MQALVLTPTRELCIQVTQALRTYGTHTGLDVVAVFGVLRFAASRVSCAPAVTLSWEPWGACST